MILDKIRKILSEQFGIEIDSISEQTNIAEDLGADSLDIVELMTVLEEEFTITISDEDAQLLKTVGDVTAFVEEKA